MTERSLRCRDCGELVSPKARFCSNCGKALAHGGLPTRPRRRPLEHRQLTIMFCDLVNSTAIAEDLEPETFARFIEAYRTCCEGPIRRYDGLIAQYIGDGMLVYFGYPAAHEDDPDRAVRAGLEMITAVHGLEAEWRSYLTSPIAIRIGINTGMVVVGELKSEHTREQEAVFGHAVIVAARLEQLAGPNALLISAATRKLLRGAIHCRSLGRTKAKGVSAPIEVHEVLAASDAHRWHWDGGDAAANLPFVGRAQELATIERLWAQTRAGHSGAVWVSGEAGVGKSRFIKAIRETIVGPTGTFLATGTSAYATNTEFFAFVELFRRALRPDDLRADETEADGLRRRLIEDRSLDDETRQGLMALLGLERREEAAAGEGDAKRLRRLSLQAIRNWLQAQAAAAPLVLVIEDLHWAAASSLEAVDLLIAGLADCPILMILSSREEPQLAEVGRLNRITLERLDGENAGVLLRHALAGRQLSRREFRTLLERTEGLPLFIEELPKALATGTDGESPGRLPGKPGTDGSIPSTLRDTLMARLDRMGEAKILAQIGAVLGHRFDWELLRTLWEGADEALREAVEDLIRASVLRYVADEPGQDLEFRHALIEDIAYDTLLEADRRTLHARAAQAFEARGLHETRPELVARHYSGAGQAAQAFDAWLKAGKASAKRAAYEEALDRMNTAEGALTSLVSGADDRTYDSGWLELLTARSAVLSAIFGRADTRVDNDYRRLLAIAQRSSANRELFYAWRGICNLNLMRGNLTSAFDAAKETRKIAVELDDSDMLLSWHRMHGLHQFLGANFRGAINHMQAGMETSQAKRLVSHSSSGATNPIVSALSISAWAYWFDGDSETATQTAREAVSLGDQAGDCVSKAYALCLAASLSQCRHDVSSALSLSEAASDLSNFWEFPYWRAWAKLVKGWSLVHSASLDRGLKLLDEGLADYEATGAAQMKGYGLCLQADAMARGRLWDVALEKAEAALAEMRRSGIVFYTPEAFFLKGISLWALGRSRDAFATLLRGYRVAATQRSKPMIVKLSNTLWPILDQTSHRELVATRLPSIEPRVPSKSSSLFRGKRHLVQL